MAMQSCCFGWMSVKTGCYVSAVYSSIYFLKLLIIDVAYGFIDSLEVQPTDEQDKTIIEILKGHPIMNLVLDICVITFAIIGLLTSFLLVYGLYQGSGNFLVPWLYVFLICTMVDFIYAIYLIVLTIVAMLSAFSVILFLAELTFIALNFYCIVCVTVQYQEYKNTRGRSTLKKATHQPFHEADTGTSVKSLLRIIEPETPTESQKGEMSPVTVGNDYETVPAIHVASLSVTPQFSMISPCSEISVELTMQEADPNNKTFEPLSMPGQNDTPKISDLPIECSVNIDQVEHDSDLEGV